jgi:molybdopterin-containing oxidoreductase family iron-sulfur binding subunit
MADPISDSKKLDAVAVELWKHRGESLVVSGANDVSVQVVVNALNSTLGNIGKTIDLSSPSLQRAGDDGAMAELVEQMNRGEVHTLVLYGVNPGYDYADGQRFVDGLQKVALSVSFADRPDETSSHVNAVCPDHHFLEAWGDSEPVESHFSLAQPLIAPLFETRAAQESLLKWAGQQPDYYAYLRESWRKNLFPRQTEIAAFDAFWDRSLEDGVVVLPTRRAVDGPVFQGDWKQGDWKTAARSIAERSAQPGAPTKTPYELHFYESVALRDGRHANNPWLQELPDPISKVTWGNYAAIAPKLAQKLGVSEGDVVAVRTDRGRVDVPVFIQPGQQERTISVALGYGRTKAGKAG